MSVRHPIDDWPRVKELFFALHDVPPDERARRLDGMALEPAVLAHVVDLLAASDDVGERFEAPALVTMHDELPSWWKDGPTLVGRRLGRYDIVRLVGQGGMGAVYEGVRADDAFRQRVAVKTLWRGADSAVLAQRFRSERQILAGLQHPNIAGLLDGGETDERTPYLVMEFVDGVPIDEYCDARRLGIPARLDLFRQVCAAVQHAHARLVVHRDLKPTNVLVAGDGTVKLLDFGIAKLLDDPRSEGTLTGAGLSPFTSVFAAPEQVTGQPVATTTNVYALGALLCTLLAGRPPIDRELGQANLLEAILEIPAAAPSTLATPASAQARGFADAPRLAKALRGELDAIVLMALRKEPQRRYATVDALSDDVRRQLRGERVLARTDTMAYRLHTFVRRRRALVVGAGAAVAALVAGGTVALRAAHDSRLEALRAERVTAFLQTMIGAADATAGGPFTRLGPRASLAQALDSAVVRVPRVFADDPRVRVRLYTAIGSSYTAQDRAAEATMLLDSAVTLARASYGASSPVTAEASLAAGFAAMRTNHFALAGRHMREALASARGSDAGGLTARVLVGLATLDLVLGRYASAESLATQVLARETARTTAPTAARAWALRTIATTRSDTGSAATFAHAIAIMDSLGATVSTERLDGLLGLAELRAVHGRFAEAESLSDEGLRLARQGYGSNSREAAQFHSARALIAQAQDRAAIAGAEVDTAARILDGLTDVIAPVRIDIMAEQLRFLMWQRRYAEAETVAGRFLAFGRPLELPLAIATAAYTLGELRARNSDWVGAEGYYREAVSALERDGSNRIWIAPSRRALANVLTRQGRQVAADSQLLELRTTR